jgi:uncharacterized protein (DUF58 family)
MIKDYVTKIKANISIYSNKKTSNLLDGSYKSIYKGRSMNFEDLREYIIGDNVKDIDWKASARSNHILVRQFVAEKKHNIMIVLDTGKKMLADTKKNEEKKEVALMSAGTIAYLANKNGDYVGSVYNSNNIVYHQLKMGLYNIEKILNEYNADVEKADNSNLEKSLDYIVKHIKKRLIIFVITDIDGIENVSKNTLEQLTYMNDVMFINVNDADITGSKGFNIDSNKYIPELIFKDKKLQEYELKMKKQMYENAERKLKKYGISMVSIESNSEVPLKIINLLERHRNANIR